MNRATAFIATRFLFLILLVAPLALVAAKFDSAMSGRIVAELFDHIADHVASVRQGTISESLVLDVCILVVVLVWLRVVWTISVLAINRWRGREYSGLDRPLTRIIFRMLFLTPVALNAVAPRAEAVSEAQIFDIGVDSETRTVSEEFVFVSVLVTVGIAWLLRQRRLSLLRTTEVDSVTDPILLDEVKTSFESAAVRHDHAVARLERALRILSMAGINDVRWIIQHPLGLIHVECIHPRCGVHPWRNVTDRILVLDAGVSIIELSSVVHDLESRIPIVLPVGSTEAGDVWVNLEVVGTFFLDGAGSESEEVWNALCQSLALSPLHGSSHLIGTSDSEFHGRRQMLTRNESDSRMLAKVLGDSESTAVVFVSEGDRKRILVGDRDSGGPDECGLLVSGDQWLLMPMRQPIRPVRCRSVDRVAMLELLGRPSAPLRCFPPNPHTVRPSGCDHQEVKEILQQISFLVRVMGPPCVEHVEHGEVTFERSRSEELVLWLALHPQRRRRSIARSEMWSTPVKDSTFSNITSDVRRTLTAAELPPEKEQWLSITLTDDLPLHHRIVTDVSVLNRCLDHARRFPEDGGAQVVAFGLDFVRGCPLEGSGYLWRDATGITTEIAVTIVRASMLCAEMALERGDAEELYWSSAKGLMAVPGHEGLVSLRMRQHAQSGDNASLVTEWESYCRALATDEWGDARPSPKMVELWTSLSGSNKSGTS